ncbi:MAG TPA: hypothetical protein VHP34_06175 [Alphaproteobacteria bacterium]|nr:hypothetical protein [Alphaproteobacteria bacterium]
MTDTLSPKYRAMSAADIEAALADKNDSQIMQELACLMEKYTREVRKCLQEGKSLESLRKPQACALEDMALRMVLDAAKPTITHKS